MNIIDKVRASLAGNWKQDGYGGEEGPGCVLNHYHRVNGGLGATPAWDFFWDFTEAEYAVDPFVFNDQVCANEEDMLLHLKHASVAYDEQQGVSA